MPFSLDELRQKKGEVAEKLTIALKEEFNIAGLNVAHGITRNVDGDLDLAIRLSDTDNPEALLGDDVIEFAEETVQRLLPGSKPNVTAIQGPKAL
jgi:hypothetical protein